MTSNRKHSSNHADAVGNNLRELTHKMHELAETQPFAQEMISGEVSNRKYATYLWNQHPQYNLLETLAMVHGLLDVRIAPKIHDDYQELWDDDPNQPPLLPVVKEYMDYLMTIQMDPQKLMAHLYVRHMGDLSGGQMIAKRVPGSGTMYKFDEDVKILKERIRAKCDDSLADEANVCFEFAAKMFEQMSELSE